MRESYRSIMTKSYNCDRRYQTLLVWQQERLSGITSNREISMQFVVETDKIEIVIQNRPSTGRIDTELEMESCAFLESVMDEVAFGSEADNDPLISMTKYHNAGKD